jgi:ribokinase
MMDLVVRVPRLPRVGESLFGHEFATFVGGKGGNQALAAARLGADAKMIGRVGTDRFGERIIEMLMAGGVNCDAITRDASVGTGVAIPMVFDDGNNSIISIPQANLALGASEIEAARETITNASALLVQFEVSFAATLASMTLAREANVPVFLNPAPFDAAQAYLVDLADYVILNDVEAALLAPGATADPVSQAQVLLKRGPRAVVVTLGGQGCVVVTESTVDLAPAFRVEAVDSVGAGDAFSSAFAVEVAGGMPLLEAASFACAAGAVSVTRRGAAASLPTRDEVLALVSERQGR